jgi:hypothetical protein
MTSHDGKTIALNHHGNGPTLIFISCALGNRQLDDPAAMSFGITPGPSQR